MFLCPLLGQGAMPQSTQSLLHSVFSGYKEQSESSLAWLFVACGACYIASFCSALAVTLGKKEACFLKAGSIVLLCHDVYTQPAVLHEWDKPSSIILVG